MRNLGLYIGSSSTAILGANNVVDAHILSVPIWTAIIMLIGWIVFCIIGGSVGALLDDTVLKKPMEKLTELCHSIGRKLLNG